MLKDGVVSNYALFGAMAQIRYTEAVATLDADILVALPDETGLDLLRPIYAYCARRGYLPSGEAIVVGEWPVQFIPAFDSLTRDAMTRADVADYEGLPLRVVRADDLAVIALSVGRGKDFLRVQSLIAAGAARREDVKDLAARYGLEAAWRRYVEQFDAR